VSYERIHGVNLSQLVAVFNVKPSQNTGWNWVQFLDWTRIAKDKGNDPNLYRLRDD